MFAFYFQDVGNCLLKLFYEFAAYRVVAAVFLVLVAIELGRIFFNIFSKRKNLFNSDWLYFICLLYLCADVYISVDCVFKSETFNSGAQVSYSICLLKFSALTLLDAVNLGITLIKDLRKKHKVNEQETANTKNLKGTSAKGGESGLSGENALNEKNGDGEKSFSEDNVYKILENSLDKRNYYDATDKNPIDINVSYLLMLINELQKRNVTLDEKEWLDELAFSVRQAYSYDENSIRDLNCELEKLVKIITKYNVVA